MLEHWTSVLHRHWGIDATLHRLSQEDDLSFLADTADGQNYILKVMRPGCEIALVDMQIRALRHIAKQAPQLSTPEPRATLDGREVVQVPDENGKSRLVWVQAVVSGRCFHKASPKSLERIEDLGRVLGATDKSLSGFTDPRLGADLKGNLTQADWIAGELEANTNPSHKALIGDIASQLRAVAENVKSLESQAIYHCANDFNLLTSGSLLQPDKVSSLVCLGNLGLSPRVCSLIAAAACIVLDHPAPEAALAALVAGYHAAYPLKTQELNLVWPLLQAHLALSIVTATPNSADSDDTPSATASAWHFLEGNNVHGGLLAARLRAMCNLPVVEGADRVMAWLERERGNFSPLMGEDLAEAPMGSLSVERSTWPQNPFHLPLEEAARIGEEFEDNGRIWLGHYYEPRLIYAEPAFRKGPWKASNRRTVHLAIDAFAPAGTPMFAPLRGEVFVAEYRSGHLDYGGVIILRHETPEGDSFYTLYGHLSPEFLDRLKPGDIVEKGEQFCLLGDPSQNGGWAPHVHFQLALTTDGIEADWPGVGDPDEMYLWSAICPNPAVLLNLPDEKVRYRPTDKSRVLAEREAHFGGSLRSAETDPVMLVRGWRHHVFDEWGRPYLDVGDNAPVIGHAHPRIQAAAADQLKRIDATSRYVHPAQTAFASRLLSKLPDRLEICFTVGSGPEAHQLALLLARAHTGATGVITALLDPAIKTLQGKGHRLASFVAEAFPLPGRHMPEVYAKVRAAGGLYIADESQTGLGRLGDHYFGFEDQGVIPDIVLMDDLLGNGHSMGVVVTTKEIAASFAKGSDFRSCLQGSTLEYRTCTELLDIIDDEGLQENARLMGSRLSQGLKQIGTEFNCVGHISCKGLLAKIELIKGDGRAATDICSYILSRLRDYRVLMGRTGAKKNLLAIRPPMTIEADDVEMILHLLPLVLREIEP
ncbi:aminotransferase class III-fold pyridoxal phosphate-dependent enzyme [Rhizobium sp. L1K21]|uniref:aminotransferase class III-fold pyridoxal phosphate-dependent enzyme n=1 Tax=Rhizobium sp. L1K21 TaxID=2954933 RepID=UPI0020936552|nr:aminotransferase class III-fold pyridoxal phosphate-dependent enzyme [Rhizobium sp. L1K21]MCO6187882.1 aminotransferase class III-fold pyridoxal phosphate-dependent enzyme [Rhizobium sp. L1K21]